MTFKTQPHRYSIDLAPTSRARCRGCRQLIERGSLRLAVHAFVRPNRATVFARHLAAQCMGKAVSTDVMRARGVGSGVSVDGAVDTHMVAHAWMLVEAQAERESGRVGK